MYRNLFGVISDLKISAVLLRLFYIFQMYYLHIMICIISLVDQLIHQHWVGATIKL